MNFYQISRITADIGIIFLMLAVNSLQKNVCLSLSQETSFWTGEYANKSEKKVSNTYLNQSHHCSAP